MVDTVTLTDHEAIRDWAAARAGYPAGVDSSPAPGVQPVLRLVVGEHGYEGQDRPGRPPCAGGYALVGWDGVFRLFAEHQLALVVAVDAPCHREEFHQIIRR